MQRAGPNARKGASYVKEKWRQRGLGRDRKEKRSGREGKSGERDRACCAFVW